MFSLNYRDARPIYEQVKDGLRHLVVTGAIEAGDQLPSVRALASSLAINPNTIQRAYESLEGEGYLYTLPGKGSFAAQRADVRAERRVRLLQDFDAAASELLFLGMTAEELAQRVSTAVGAPGSNRPMEGGRGTEVPLSRGGAAAAPPAGEPKREEGVQ